MSVPKSRRKDAAAEFIQAATQLRWKTIHVTKKFPKSYWHSITNSLQELAKEIFVNCIKGNAVFMHQGMSQRDFDLRRMYFMKAYSSADALNAEITFCYGLLMEGENIFRDAKDRDKKFEDWTALGVETKNRLRALLKSDKERFKGYGKE